MARWKPKSCPRCLGDMFIGNDEDGWYEKCVQCSYQIGLHAEIESAKKSTRNNEGQAPTKKHVGAAGLQEPTSVDSRPRNGDLRVLNHEEWGTLRRRILSVDAGPVGRSRQGS